MTLAELEPAIFGSEDQRCRGFNPTRGAYRCPSPQQALVLVRTSQSRRPAAAVTAAITSIQRAGFPSPLAGEPALQDSVTEWLR
jgi:hypothetical protein